MGLRLAGCLVLLLCAEGHGRITAGRASSQPLIVLPGGGLFFYWQAGALKWVLREQASARLGCEGMRFAGASAGGLAATLACNGVDFDEATALALDLSDRAGVWDRPLGLAGIWGSLIEEWLDTLLPESAAADSSGRLGVFVTRLRLAGLWSPLVRAKHDCLTEFGTRAELIDAALGTAHLPFFLNGRFSKRLQGRRYVDGSFRLPADEMVRASLGALGDAAAEGAGAATKMGEERAGGLLVLDWKSDPWMVEHKDEWLKLVSKDAIWRMVERGEEFAASQEDLLLRSLASPAA